MSASPDLMMLESAARQIAKDNAMPRRFITVARTLLQYESRETAVERLAQCLDSWDARDFQKAAVTPQTFEEVWDSGAPFDMQTAWLESIAPYSILDALRGRASLMPDVGTVLLASGSVANVTTEGAPKAVTRVTLAPSDDEDKIKAAAMIVMSKELALSPYASKVFENALRDAVIEATNKAALAALPKTSIVSTGTAWGDLQAGIAAAGPSQSYVVAATRELVIELAFASDGRMGVNGGEPIPGVLVVPHAVENPAGDAPMTVIPASRVKLVDWGLRVRNAGHASVQMDSEPHMPPTGSTVMVSLWQHNLVALLAERTFRILGADPAIEVG